MPIKNKVISGPSDQSEKKQNQIILANDLELRYDEDEKKKDIKLIADHGTMDLPDDFHFCAILHEMFKQYYHSKRWFKNCIKVTMDENNFKFKKWKCNLYTELDLMKQQKLI